jgi:hypothetical protein
MTIDEIICKEKKKAIYKRKRAWMAKSDHMMRERMEESEYHESIAILLRELKERRRREGVWK